MLKHIRIEPFLNSRPFINDPGFISTRSAIPASVQKHPGDYKRSDNMAG